MLIKTCQSNKFNETIQHHSFNHEELTNHLKDSSPRWVHKKLTFGCNLLPICFPAVEIANASADALRPQVGMALRSWLPIIESNPWDQPARRSSLRRLLGVAGVTSSGDFDHQLFLKAISVKTVVTCSGAYAARMDASYSYKREPHALPTSPKEE